MSMKKLLFALILMTALGNYRAFGADTRVQGQIVTEVPGSDYTILNAPSAGGIPIATGTQHKFQVAGLVSNCVLTWDGSSFVCWNPTACGAGLGVVDVNNAGQLVCDAHVAFDNESNIFTVLQEIDVGGASTALVMDNRAILQFAETDANGNNSKGFSAPAVITTTNTCTFEDDSDFIPDSCVGDGTDGQVANTCSAGSAITALATSSSTCDSNVAFDDEINVFSVEQDFATFIKLQNQGNIYWMEANANGSNQLNIRAPAAITTDQTCNLENDANFIPDSCVGNGTDDVGTTPLTGTATIDFADPGTNTCTAESAVTVTGSAAGDACFVGVPTASVTANTWFPCRISASNTCQIKACKNGNAAEDPGSGSFRCTVVK
jgi:hypothetical protein